MKKFKILDKLKKIILIILCTITVFFSMPVKSNAEIIPDFTEILLFIPDAIMKILSKNVSGERGNLSELDINLDGWDADSNGELFNFNVTPYDIFTSGMTYETVDYNGNYAGESIKMPLLNINFFKDTKVKTDATNSADILRPVISSVYKSLRNVVLIVMLVVLLYVGIRIIIASAVSDQVKYKQWIMDWVIGICLVVVLQYIMSFLMNVNEMVVKMLGENKETMYHISLSELEGLELNRVITGIIPGYQSWDRFLDTISSENVVNDAMSDANINYELDNLNYFFADHIAVAEGKFFKKEKFTFDPATATMDISNSEYTAYDWGNNVPINARIFVNQESADRAVYRGNIIEYLRTIISFGSDYVYEYKPSDVSGSSMLHTREGSKTQPATLGYIILYLLLVIETVMFLYTYLKRVFKLAFYTMIAPLIAFMYPIDKLGDGKAQAFNTWFKEYLYNVLIQPLHLLLYTVFIYAGMELMRESMIYAIGAYAYMIAAEKFFKKIFGFDKAPAGGAGSLGNMMAGGLAMKGLSGLKGASGKGGNGGKDGKGNGSGKIKLAKRKAQNGITQGGAPVPASSGGFGGAGGSGGRTTFSGSGGGSPVPSSGGFAPSSLGRGPSRSPVPSTSGGGARSKLQVAGRKLQFAGRELNRNAARRITGGRSSNLLDGFRYDTAKNNRFWGGVGKSVGVAALKGVGTAAGAALGVSAGALAGMAASAFTGEDKFLDGVQTGVIGGAALGAGLTSKGIDAVSNFSDTVNRRYLSQEGNEYDAAKYQMNQLLDEYPDFFEDMNSNQIEDFTETLSWIDDDIADEKDLKQIKNMINQGLSGEEIAVLRDESKKFGDLTSKSNMESYMKYYESQNINLDNASAADQTWARDAAEKKAREEKEKAIKEAQKQLNEIDEKRRKDLAYARMSGDSIADVKRKWRDRQTEAQNNLNAANSMSVAGSTEDYNAFLKQRIIESSARRVRNYQEKKGIND